MSKQAQFEELRKRHPVFRYLAYHYGYENGELWITYDFEIPGLAEFHPGWRFPLDEKRAKACGLWQGEGTAGHFPQTAAEAGKAADSEKMQKGAAETGKAAGSGNIRKGIAEAVDSLIFQLGMAELVSYWKTACPPRVEISAGSLSKAQADWWKKLYFHGLGEFFFVNGISAGQASFMALSVDGKERKTAVLPEAAYQGCLVPIGGGKDSIVTLRALTELMEQAQTAAAPSIDIDITTYSVNRTSAVAEVVALCKEKSGDVWAKRSLDGEMLRLNREGYLNGHTPFSAIVAFSSFLAAVLYGKRYITLSNENSANESTVRGSKVNHQYSKSYEFEQDFGNYIKAVVQSPIRYFSLLRPLSEIQIARIFAGCTRYQKVFRSCNAGSKQGVWCCNCPKCLFVYIILSPFLAEKQLLEIFGEPLLEKEGLETDFRKLAGLDENKPFECVGTRNEVLAALGDLIRRREQAGEALPLLLARYREEILALAPPLSALLSGWCSEHAVPEPFLAVIRKLGPVNK